jgi:hypothetical protein
MLTTIRVLVPLAALLTGSLASAEEVRGVITKVDPDKQEVVLQVRGKGIRGLPMAFRLEEQTQILLGRQSVHLADLRPGARARILYENRDGWRVALAITAHGSPSRPAGAALLDPTAITGVLQRVALTDREIVIIGPGPSGPETETTLVVPEGIKITKDNQPVRFEDLKEGQHVAVRTEKRDGKVVAASIQIGAAALAAPEKNDRIEKLRQLLKLADFFLQQMGERKNNSQP